MKTPIINQSIFVLLFIALLIIPFVAQGQESAFLHRLFNPRTGDHLYTSSDAEANSVKNLGYKDEGITGTVLTTNLASTTPLFRLFNPVSRDHFYTTRAAERDQAISQAGYRFEGAVGLVFTNESSISSPLFRLYNSQTGDHFYTTDILERLRASERGYNFEGNEGFINDRLFNLVRAQNIQPDQQVSSPLVVQGEARGFWFFEASFPIRLLDELGRVLATGFGQANGDWMTNNFVPFTSSQLMFSTSTDADEGFLFLEKDNPSGLPQFDDQLIVPVKF